MNPVIQRARALRNNMSKPEAKLWPHLKRLRENGYRFRRQAPFRGYFLDFVCFTRRLVIEVDGSHHADDLQADHDLVRDRILRSQGFLVLRIAARDVFRDLDGVVWLIESTVKARPSTRDKSKSPDTEPGPGLPTRLELRSSRPPH